MTPFDSTAHAASDIDLPAQPAPFDRAEPAPTHQGNGDKTVTASLADPSSSGLVPWLMTLAYWLGRYVVIPFYFRRVEIIGQEQLPLSGAVILAPTHRSRWDAILVPLAAGYKATGRHLRFMVTADEVIGVQGWFIRRMGGFAINTKRPQVSSLRHGIEILQRREPLVIFPEGGELLENRLFHPNKLHPGLARLALQAEASQADLSVQVVPIAICYRPITVSWRCRARICIGQPLHVSHYNQGSVKQNARKLTTDLYNALQALDTADGSNAQN